MTERLFVYGTLDLGRPNEHMLATIGCTWEPAIVTGTLHQDGWSVNPEHSIQKLQQWYSEYFRG